MTSTDQYEYSNFQGRHMVATDPQGATFFLTERESEIQQSHTNTDTVAIKKRSKWRCLMGLVLVYCAILMNLNWIWGVLFLVWVVPDIRRGTTFFLEPVTRRENPVIYWAIMLTWIGLSAYLLYESL